MEDLRVVGEDALVDAKGDVARDDDDVPVRKPDLGVSVGVVGTVSCARTLCGTLIWRRHSTIEDCALPTPVGGRESKLGVERGVEREAERRSELSQTRPPNA